jgi:hypothetical protein
VSIHIAVEGLYCKRPTQCLAPSKILTPHPLTAWRVCTPPPLVQGEDTLAGWRGGGGVNILEDARHCSVLYICKYFVHTAEYAGSGGGSVGTPHLQHKALQYLLCIFFRFLHVICRLVTPPFGLISAVIEKRGVSQLWTIFKTARFALPPIIMRRVLDLVICLFPRGLLMSRREVQSR